MVEGSAGNGCHPIPANSTSGQTFRSRVVKATEPFMRCPVDGKWRMMGNVNSRDLSEAELEEAGRRRF